MNSKKILACILALACLLTPGGALADGPVRAATDVVQPMDTEWFGSGVRYCVEQGFFRPGKGTPFDPHAQLSKIEFVVMVSRALGLYDEGEQPFYLAAEGHFAAAAEMGLVTAAEFPQGRWAQPLNRLEAAMICSRALAAGGVQSGSDVYIDNTPDKYSIPQPYRGAVNSVYAAGVMKGVDATLAFHGENSVTKAQGCVMLHRLLVEQARQAPALPAAYGKLFGSYTTAFGPEEGEVVSVYRENSIFNMLRAGNGLNGVVIQPGQVLSFNDTLGYFDGANGYKEGIVVSGNKKVPGYGGGVCQASTTLFVAALNANMTIKERHNHSLRSTYVPAGADSAIAHPHWDLRIQNPYNCPVRIVFDSDPAAQTMTVKLYGAADTYIPTVTWPITEKNGVYTLTRYADGEANYSCTSRYRN